MEDSCNENLECFENQELDRKRIASELHDTSLQDLTHIIHQIELSGLYIDMDPIKAKLELEDISMKLRKVIQDIRDTIFDLRPMSFDDLDLEDAIDQYISFIKKKYDIQFITKIESIDFLDEKRKLAVYRIIQECLMNSAKHANPSKICLEIRNTKIDIIITIKDDGIGFENEKISHEDGTHYGLDILKDRVKFLNGKYSIKSDKNNGTCVEVRIPNRKGVSHEN